MRTVRPQGLTFRITQPYGLRLSYLRMHPSLHKSIPANCFKNALTYPDRPTGQWSVAAETWSWKQLMRERIGHRGWLKDASQPSKA
jgi:hypothetical protein